MTGIRTTGIRMIDIRMYRLLGTLLVVLTLLAACGRGQEPGDSAAGGPVTIRYWLWDTNQLPAYQACADVFQQEHPDIRIQLEHFGWQITGTTSPPT
jgi:multiple sugar transport system substrate-binding protein